MSTVFYIICKTCIFFYFIVKEVIGLPNCIWSLSNINCFIPNSWNQINYWSKQFNFSLSLWSPTYLKRTSSTHGELMLIYFEICTHFLAIFKNLYVPDLIFQYSTQPEGFLEIELGDWKDNRVFRLMAVDQGEMIFHDTIFDKSKTFMS